MTSNFKSFKEFVEGKFESLSNFSKIATGSFQTYKGLETKADTKENRLSIEHLYTCAVFTDFDKEEVEVSDFDRMAIKMRMEYILETENITKAKWFKNNHVTNWYYSQLLTGHLKRKNCAYERLIKLMGLT